MNIFFHIHYFFLSMLLLNMKQILGWTPRQPHVCCVCPPHWSQV